MRDHSSSYDLPTAADTPAPGRRFSRTLFGYRRGTVDETVAEMEQQVEDLEQQSIELREELLDARQQVNETDHDLTRARAELRYWNDRASYVDSEVARARRVADEIEHAARDRAETIEADAQERSLQLIDRVCSEANAMLQHAREEAREMFLRFEQDVDLSHQKLEKLEDVRRNVARTMQGALQQFEEAVRDLDTVSPTKRIDAGLEGPVRRAGLTFGKQKAHEAAARFDAASSDRMSAVLSTPVSVPNLHVTSINGEGIEVPGDSMDDIVASNKDASSDEDTSHDASQDTVTTETVLTASVE
ncbi:MAG: hypothetical protein ABI200_05050 [Gaiellales bacterium]